MPTDQILSMLIAERDKLDRAIAALQGTSRAGTARRTPKPATTASANKSASAPTANHKKGATWTPEMRAKARRRAKLLWAKRQKASKKG